MRAFLLLFLIFPVLELFVFVKVSAAIGFFPALLLIIAGSALGVLVMRVAGLATALRARESLQRGELPAEDMFKGISEDEQRAFVGTLKTMLRNIRKHDF